MISQAEKQDAINGSPVPSIAETKDIAEQGFIFGQPLVMNHGAMYAYSIDTKSPAFTAPFNVIKNEARVYTPKDRAIPLPNSDTPFMDLRAEPMVLSIPAVDKGRYFIDWHRNCVPPLILFRERNLFLAEEIQIIVAAGPRVNDGGKIARKIVAIAGNVDSERERHSKRGLGGAGQFAVAPRLPVDDHLSAGGDGV